MASSGHRRATMPRGRPDGGSVAPPRWRARTRRRESLCAVVALRRREERRITRLMDRRAIAGLRGCEPRAAASPRSSTPRRGWRPSSGAPRLPSAICALCSQAQRQGRWPRHAERSTVGPRAAACSSLGAPYLIGRRGAMGVHAGHRRGRALSGRWLPCAQAEPPRFRRGRRNRWFRCPCPARAEVRRI
ncbi:hypothetical protein ACQJBY_002721 [Aegilops geniculata]